MIVVRDWDRNHPEARYGVGEPNAGEGRKRISFHRVERTRLKRSKEVAGMRLRTIEGTGKINAQKFRLAAGAFPSAVIERDKAAIGDHVRTVREHDEPRLADADRRVAEAQAALRAATEYRRTVLADVFAGGTRPTGRDLEEWLVDSDLRKASAEQERFGAAELADAIRNGE